MRILIINGPNLNLLGNREPQTYGSLSLWEIENQLKRKFPDVTLEFYQSNSEGTLIDFIHKAADSGTAGVVLNPGAFSHYSYAIRDAIASINVPVIEVHISNVHARDKFRHQSVTAAACKGVISGFGSESYELALSYLVSSHKPS
jgi:3-dehydroquinate dehydratase-2